MSPLALAALVILFIYAVILHEYAHGWAAYKLGDSTAKNLGRLTLNPLSHVDPLGTVALPVLLIATGSPVVFGWAKPVPVNFMNLHNPKRDMALVALAGPLVNVVLALILSQILKIAASGVEKQIFASAIIINLVLAIFNMIPIPPLDGSRLVMSVLPRPFSLLYARLENYGIFIVLLLLYLGLFDAFVWPLVDYFAKGLGVS